MLTKLLPVVAASLWIAGCGAEAESPRIGPTTQPTLAAIPAEGGSLTERLVTGGAKREAEAQKSIGNLPLEITIPVPEVPDEIQQPSPPITEEAE